MGIIADLEVDDGIGADARRLDGEGRVGAWGEALGRGQGGHLHARGVGVEDRPLTQVEAVLNPGLGADGMEVDAQRRDGLLPRDGLVGAEPGQVEADDPLLPRGHRRIAEDRPVEVLMGGVGRPGNLRRRHGEGRRLVALVEDSHGHRRGQVTEGAGEAEDGALAWPAGETPAGPGLAVARDGAEFVKLIVGQALDRVAWRLDAGDGLEGLPPVDLRAGEGVVGISRVVGGRRRAKNDDRGEKDACHG